MKRLHNYEVQALEGNIGKNIKDLGSTDTKITTLWKAHLDGCAACNHTGYKGRIGIYEVLHNSEEIQTLIVSNATSDKIQTAAIDQGMLTMQLDGLVKALRAETTIEEILRVTAEA
jgi:type IV pilus assembly protein PilB